jgi:hypothetical protein
MKQMGTWLVFVIALVASGGIARADDPPTSPTPPPPAAAPPDVAPSPSPAVSAAPAPNDFAQPPPAAQADRPAHKDDDNTTSALDYFRMGAFGGIGFPRPLTLEGFAKIDNIIGFGLEYSLLPAITIDNADTTFWALAGDVRVFPFRNGFFIGLAGGRQHVSASGLATLPSLPGLPSSVSEQITGDNWFINPRIGFLSTASWGLTVGIDIGVQIPLTTSMSSTIPQNLPISVPLATDAYNTAHYLTNSVIPTVDLLRIGLLL